MPIKVWRRRVWRFASVVGVLTLTACNSGGSHSSRNSGSRADEASLREMARDAYIFSYPLVMNYRTMYRQAIAGGAEFGKWLNLGLATPQDADIVTPNNDTPYSYAWVDLRAEPWVLTMPLIEADRYYTSQWDDLWGYVLDNPGSVLDGNGGVSVLLAGPGWTGDLPAGLDRVVKGESDILGTLTRTQFLAAQGGMPRVEEIQHEYRLEPLSAYLGTSAPPAAPQIDWPSWKEGAEQKLEFWDYVAFMLQFVTRNPVDQPMYDALAKLGLGTDQPWDPWSLAPEVRTALTEGITDGQAALKHASEVMKNAVGVFGTRAQLGTDYLNRALGVYAGIFGNVAEQAMYFSLVSDDKGKPLDGSDASYTLTFSAGQRPPAKYFWSMTMYSLPSRFLVNNSIDRYSIGNRTPGLRENPDGSLTITFAKDDPGGERSANWLPAPDGPFWVVLRTYGPEKAILDGTWKPPAVVRVP
ncbi:DUF1254 domain-containing protein [Mycobacterium sp. 141]|uniref:DUF1254 domain-containing protein n=1 Tax=Mycobacterium sp. 141 TaxID=1120797 RepID=UPI001E39062A|nr:DUF1214 domain-containing protein [Mycobacterium sp. 141]